MTHTAAGIRLTQLLAQALDEHALCCEFHPGFRERVLAYAKPLISAIDTRVKMEEVRCSDRAA